jgi:hypothetical protein
MSDLKERLANLTPKQRADLALLLRKQKSAGAKTIGRQESGEPRVLSFAQQQLWFLEQLSPGNLPYNVPFYLRLRGEVNIEALQRTLDAIVERHHVLRTKIGDADGLPIPTLESAWSVELKQQDLRPFPEPERENRAKQLLKEEASRPFDFARDLMLRAMLIQLADRECLLLHNSHHIAWDLGSKAVFYREIEALYEANCLHSPSPLPELSIQYSDYAAWQKEWLCGDVLQELVKYWKEQLAGAPAKLELPTDHVRPRIQTKLGAKRTAVLPKSLLDMAKALSAQSGVTLFMTMLSAFCVFLHLYTGQEDILIGSPVDGRDNPEVRDLIGFFINTVVMRIHLSRQLTFRELMRQAREVTLGALAHSQLPFHKVVEAIRPPRDLSRSPLFQVNFRLQPGPPKTTHLYGLEVEGPHLVDNATAKFDLALELPSVEGALGFWEYSVDLFEEKTIAQMDINFSRLLAALLAAPDAPLSEHEFIWNRS